MSPPIEPALRERILDASPRELAELRERHPEAAEAIDRLLGANEAIARALAGDGALNPGAGPARPSGASRPAARLGPLLAAAAVAALVLWPRGAGESGVGIAPQRSSPASPSLAGEPTSPGSMSPGSMNPAWRNPGSIARASNASGLDVDAPTDFMVIPTDDPDIAVVWLLNGDD